ncbi:MAG TPA: methyltransferase domain-containing protein, partial [Anaerolineae bacterium]
MTKGSLRFLDASGGNGLASIPFAAQGHHVTLLDYSTEMLAEARRNAEE